MLKNFKALLAIAAAVLFLTPQKSEVKADAFGCPSINAALVSRGYVQITVSNTAVGLTSVAGNLAAITVENADIRVRYDGTSPTASVGTPLQAGTSFIVCGANMNTFKAIRQSSDAKISVEYFG